MNGNFLGRRRLQGAGIAGYRAGEGVFPRGKKRSAQGATPSLGNRADAADLGAGNADFNVAVTRNLFLQILVNWALQFTNLAAAHTGDMDVVARPVAFVIVAMAAKMEQVELVDQTVALKKVECAIDGHSRDLRVNILCVF